MDELKRLLQGLAPLGPSGEAVTETLGLSALTPLGELGDGMPGLGLAPLGASGEAAIETLGLSALTPFGELGDGMPGLGLAPLGASGEAAIETLGLSALTPLGELGDGMPGLGLTPLGASGEAAIETLGLSALTPLGELGDGMPGLGLAPLGASGEAAIETLGLSALTPLGELGDGMPGLGLAPLGASGEAAIETLGLSALTPLGELGDGMPGLGLAPLGASGEAAIETLGLSALTPLGELGDGMPGLGLAPLGASGEAAIETLGLSALTPLGELGDGMPGLGLAPLGASGEAAIETLGLSALTPLGELGDGMPGLGLAPLGPLGEVRQMSLDLERAIRPSEEILRSLSASVARTVQPLKDCFSNMEDWELSIKRRMAAVDVPWAVADDVRVAGLGFARIARLHDISTGTAPFGSQAQGIFEEELGLPVPFDADGESKDRDIVAIQAGLNPEVVTFPRSVYPEVLCKAGFEVWIESIPTIVSDNGDRSGTLDSQHYLLFAKIETWLRIKVKTELEKLVGDRWYKERVPGEIWKRWQDRREADRQERGDSYHFEFYADFTDWSQIICRKDNWREVFHRYFRSKDDVQVSLQRLNPVRNAIAHNRPLVRFDQLILVSEGSRVMTALGVRWLRGGRNGR